MAPRKKKPAPKRSLKTPAKKARKRQTAKAAARPRSKTRRGAPPAAKKRRSSRVPRSFRRRGRGSAQDRSLGPESAGQSGDTIGLPRRARADSESVEELVEEGQAFEAGIVEGVEDAPEGEVRTREVPEDDVPQEYLDED